MVNINIKFILYILIMLSMSLSVFAKEKNNKPQIFLFSDKTEIILGRPIRLEVYAVNLTTKISDINLAPLKKNYGIELDYIINNTSDKRWPNKSVQVLKLKLYPRRSGKLIIPSLSINKVRSNSKTISISEKGNSTQTLSTISPYERQQIISHFTVTSSDSSARLSIDNESSVKGFNSTPLLFKRIKNKAGTYLLQIGWALSAIKAGTINLELPPIEYSVSGVKRKKYYLPIKSLTIKSLPLYVPPTTPVGHVEISSDTERKKLYQTDSLSYWNIKLKGRLNNIYNLPPVLRQIKNNSEFSFLPANTKYYPTITDHSLLNSVEHSIPFKPLKSGFLRLPRLKVQYFDPDDGKLKSITHNSQTIFVLSIFWRSIFIIGILILIFIVLKLSYAQWQRYIYSKKKRIQAINKLQTNNITNIRESIVLISESEFWPKNMTLSHWSDLWRKKYIINNHYDELVKSLSEYIYSNNDNNDQSKLRIQLIDLINGRKRIKKTFLLKN